MKPTFKMINGQPCRMVEPTPLQLDSQMPCVVRLIQDDSPMGRANKMHICTNEYLDKTYLAKTVGGYSIFTDTLITPISCYAHYEIIGYPVEEGSAEWMIYHAMNGKQGMHPDITRPVYYDGKYMTMDGDKKALRVDLELFISSYPVGWEIYTPQYKVGDWVEFRDIEGIKHGMVEGKREEYSILCAGVSQSVGEKFILRKLSPSEVIVKIGCMSGTIGKSSEPDRFLVWHSSPKIDFDYSIIKFSALDATTRQLVEGLLKAQEER